MMRCLSLLMLTYALVMPAFAKPLVADISSHEITIHTSFDGTELTLFGARNEAGDIIVVIRGPKRDATVRRKEQISGMWVNHTQEVFYDIPGFYAMASSRPFEEIPKSLYFHPLSIGFDEALLDNGMMEKPPEQRRVFQRALLRDLRFKGLYATLPSKISFIGETLFKTTLPFPDNMPRGDYTAEVYLFSDGGLVGMQTTPIHVYKSGFDAFVYEAAHKDPLIYGLVAVMLALCSGWAVSALFEKI
ncbi:MAG: TIGR02186 family protein [Rickettsiales bacterium]|nr:TIGR02186 family protein [Rickettsiales bacterium]